VRTTRRRFLQIAVASLPAWGSASTSFAALATVRAAVPPGPPASDDAFFDAREREILTLVIERMVAAGPRDTPDVAGSEAVAAIDRICGALDPEITRPLPLLLRLVEWGPLVFDLRLSSFSAMTPAERDSSLRGWMTSRLSVRRLGFSALKNLAMLGWYSQPGSWKAIGYAGPLLRETRP
jgi:hypothetical protein